MFAGNDPVTGKKLYLSGNATDETAAVKLRDTLRKQVDAKTARTSVTSNRHSAISHCRSSNGSAPTARTLL